MDQQSSDSPNPYASPGTPTIGEPISANDPFSPLVEPIHVFGRFSRKDLQLAVKMVRGKSINLFLRLLFAWVGLMIFFHFYYIFLHARPALFAIMMAALFAPLALLIITIRWLNSQSTSGASDYQDIYFFEDNIEAHGEGVIVKYQWSWFRGFLYRKDIVVLLVSGRKRFGIAAPRSLFQTEHDWNCFLGLIQRKLPRG